VALDEDQLFHCRPQTVRAFDAAARWAACARAADELSLTRSAVSHHIKGSKRALNQAVSGSGWLDMTEPGMPAHAKPACLALIRGRRFYRSPTQTWRTLTVSVPAVVLQLAG